MEITLTISDSTSENDSMESEKVSVVSLGTMEIFEITRLKIRSSRSGYLKRFFSVEEISVYLKMKIHNQNARSVQSDLDLHYYFTNGILSHTEQPKGNNFMYTFRFFEESQEHLCSRKKDISYLFR